MKSHQQIVWYNQKSLISNHALLLYISRNYNHNEKRMNMFLNPNVKLFAHIACSTWHFFQLWHKRNFLGIQNGSYWLCVCVCMSPFCFSLKYAQSHLLDKLLFIKLGGQCCLIYVLNFSKLKWENSGKKFSNRHPLHLRFNSFFDSYWVCVPSCCPPHQYWNNLQSHSHPRSIYNWRLVEDINKLWK